MSRFSDLLNDFAEKKHASTAGMAAYCDSDRTTIYRFRRGTRTPESPAMVETMADYMQLTLSEKQDLLKAYEITMAGEGNYFRRQAVREFMGSFKPFGFSNSLDSSNIEIELPSFDPSMMKLAAPIHGRDAVYQVINNALSIEGFSRSVDKRIDLIMDPTEYKVMESVRIQGRLSPDLKVRHIFAMNSRNARVPEGDTASLDTLQAVLSSCSDGFSYEPHYYYRDQVLADPFPLQGGLLVSTFWALTFSDDLSCGVFYDAPHLVAFFRQQFENILRSCPRMVRRAEDFSSFVEMTSEMQMFKTGRSAVQYMPQMCMLSVLTEHQISRHLKVPADAESLRTLSRKLRQPDGESALQDTTLIATLGGIRRFLQTGKLDELSDDMYTPLDFDERVAAVQNYLYRPVKILKTELSLPERGLNVYAADTGCFIEFREPADKVNFLAVHEPGIIHAFTDFLRNLPEEEFFSEEEKRSVLQQLIDEAKKNAEG